MKIFLISIMISILGVFSLDAQKILFDCSTGESASNADWVIDADTRNLNSNWPTTTGGSESNPQQIPTPAQSGISGSTSETFWDGALSAWGVECVKYNSGWTIETLPYDGLITYGDGSNPQDLSNYKVFVLDEPNSLFNAAEKTAIVNFVNAGGGLFLISDHDIADRNGDGDDAVDALNDLLTSSGGFNNGLGMTLDYANFTDAPTTNVIAPGGGDPLIDGPYGPITAMEFHGATSMTINTSNNSTVKGVVYKTGATLGGTTGVMTAYCTYGSSNGRIVMITDSSPADDGTGDGGDALYNGWDQQSGDNGNIHMNATIWLMGAGATGPTLSVNPSSLTGYTYVFGSGPSSSQSFDLSGTDLDGTQVTVAGSANYEVSLDNTTFGASVNISYTAPTLNTTTIYVRLKAGLAVGTYNSENVTCSDNGTASDVTVTCNGSCEGSSNNKYIEIFNGTPATVSLDNYRIGLVTNGGTWTEATIAFTAGTNLTPGSTWVLANSSASATVIAAADQTSGSLGINGDDAVALQTSAGVNVDLVGDEGADPGTGWDVAGTTTATAEHTLVRKSSIKLSQTNWATSAGTNATNSEWIVYAQDDFTDIGSHTMDCTTPTLSVTPTTLTGFTYVQGSGPSASQTFTLSGSSLDGSQVTVTGSINYEVSLDNTTFGASVNVSYTAPTLNNTTIYVRLKAGLIAGAYNNEIVTCSDDGAASDVTVTCSGDVTGPTINVTPTTLTGFSYLVGAGPSSSQSFTLSGSSLNGSQVTITGSTNYEVSLDNTTFGASVNVSYTAPTLNNTTIYVRLKTGLVAGAYNNEIVTCSDNGAPAATDVTVTCSGDVFQPTLSVTPTTLTGFTYSEGAGPSTSQTFVLSGSNLDGTQVTVTGSANYEVSLDNTAFSASVNVTYTAPTLNNTTIYVRLKAGLLQGTYNGETITCSDDGIASDVTVNPVDGNVTAPSASCASELLISEVNENGGDKYVEIANFTGAPIDISSFDIVLYVNGSSTPSTPIALGPGTVADGDVWVIGASAIAGVTDQTSGSITFNGNDVIALRKSTVNIDVFGTIGTSTYWYDDQTAIRNSNVYNPVTTYNSTEWTFTAYAGGTPANLGSHTMVCTCEEPTIHASNITFTSITSTSMNVSWTNGDGLNRIVVASEESPVSWVPTDNTTYSANASFGSGTELGTGNYVVYNGSGSGFTVTNLTPGTTYYFKIFEYGCQAGTEDYLTSGTPEENDETTLPNDVSDLSVVCATENSMEVSWTLPTGNYDAILITVLENGTPHQPTCDGSSLMNPITDYSVADGYCDLSTPAVYVFNNIGNNVSITGLSSGQSYTIKAFVYVNSSWSVGTSITHVAEVSDVTDLQSNCGNSSSEISWINPNLSCFDEVIIAVNTSSITGIPLGSYAANSLDYTDGANPTLSDGSVIVYNGTTSPQTVTGLINGTTYFFKVFVRNGTDWSNGVEVSCSATTAISLDYGDLAIVGINTDYTNLANDDSDEIQFVCFKDITTETSIDFTDNGYERLYAGKWADSEGTITLTRTGADVPAGTVITVRGRNAAPNWHVFIGSGTPNGSLTNDDANWTITDGGAGNNVFDLNVNDQIWMMQGGTWTNPGGVHNATYSGKVLYGWTAIGWEPAPGYDDTKGSTIFQGSECSVTNLVGVLNEDKVRYDSTNTIATQRDWISRFNNEQRWTGYVDSLTYQNGGTLPDLIQISGTGFAGIYKWTGETSTDWNDCTNWLTLKVPDATSDVQFVSDDCFNDLVLLSGQTVVCKSLEISGTVLNHAIKAEGDPTAVIEVYGDVTLGGPSGVLDFDDGTVADDGTIKVFGNWNENVANGFLEGNSSVEFIGSTAQSINSVSITADFYNLKIDNSSAVGVTFENSVKVNGILNSAAGIINLNGFNLDISGEFTGINGVFSGNSTSNLTVNGSGTIDYSFYFAVPQVLNTFTMNRSGQTAVLATNLTMADMNIDAGTVQLNAGKFFTVSNTITNNVGASGLLIKSNAIGTASLIHYTENLPATCERYISGGSWGYVFPPLSAVPENIFGGSNPNFYFYDEATADYWDAVNIYEPMGWTDVPAGNLSLERGYIVYNPQTVTYNLTGGNLYFDAINNNKVFTASYTNSGTGSVGLNGVTADWNDFEGWNLFGNPYSSAIDWDQVVLSNVENVVYYYDGTTSNYKYYGGGTTYNQGITANGGSQIVPANQAFFVKATANAGTVTIPDAARTHDLQQFWKNSEISNNNFSDIVRLRIDFDNYSDETVLKLDSLATNYHDNFDGYKMFSPVKLVPQIYSIDSVNSLYSINYTKFEDVKIIPLGVFIQNAGIYTIYADEVNMQNHHVYLNDKQVNTLTNLQNISSYSFNYSGGVNDERFELWFKLNNTPYNLQPLDNQVLFTNEELSYVLPKAFNDSDLGDHLNITAELADGKALPTWLQFDGEKFYGIPVEAQDIQIKVTATDNFGASVSQLFTVTVLETTDNQTIDLKNMKIYPNPAQNIVNIEITNIFNNCSISIFDATGKLVYQIDSKQNLNTVDVSALSRGIYFIEVKDDVTLERQKLIIK